MSDQPSSPPTDNEIALLAYERYVARGRTDGFDLEDWLAAEQEASLRHAGIPKSSTAAAPATPRRPPRRHDIPLEAPDTAERIGA